MSAGAGEGKKWIWTLVGGGVLVGVAMTLEALEVHLGWVLTVLLGVGGLLLVFGACEALLKSVDGLARRAKMNEFVAGTVGGLASNIPELVMLGFVLAAAPRVGFIVSVITLHVGAAAFGIYSALLPRDPKGAAAMPRALVELSTDLYACAGAAFFTTGSIMVLMHLFDAGAHQGLALGATDLYVLGGTLLVVQVVAVMRLVRRFSGSDEQSVSSAEAAAAHVPPPPVPSLLAIGLFALLGIGASVFGGHAVGAFADTLVEALTKAGYPKMVGALILSLFASSGAFVMIASAHAKGKHDIALANASGQVTQVPFVVMPVALILLAAFSQTGLIPRTASGGVLPIDLDTTSVLFLGFPSMLILWKAIQDDGKINWLETAILVAIFGLAIYFLAAHG